MRRYSVVASLVLVLSVVSASPGLAQFPRLPDLGDIGGEVLRGRIPGLDKILQEEPSISTSFEDAIYGVAVLDGFDPVVTAPNSQQPYP